MGSFAQKDVGNPKIFAAGLVQIMSLYPAYVLADVVSPSIGLPSKATFMPALSEVKKACEDAASQHEMKRREVEARRAAAAERAAAARPVDAERGHAILKSVADEMRRRSAEAGLGAGA